jgi:predicted transcriptional regulator
MAFTVRVDEELEHALAALASSEGTSKQEIVRRAVLDRFERAEHMGIVADSVGRMIERWGDVLDRLGNA